MAINYKPFSLAQAAQVGDNSMQNLMALPQIHSQMDWDKVRSWAQRMAGAMSPDNGVSEGRSGLEAVAPFLPPGELARVEKAAANWRPEGH
jgi:hypothetical protein